MKEIWEMTVTELWEMAERTEAGRLLVSLNDVEGAIVSALIVIPNRSAEEVVQRLERLDEIEEQHTELREAADAFIRMLETGRVAIYGAAVTFREKARRLRKVLDAGKDGEE